MRGFLRKLLGSKPLGVPKHQKETLRLDGQSAIPEESPSSKYEYVRTVDREKLNNDFSLLDYGIKIAFQEGALSEGCSFIQKALDNFQINHCIEGEAYALHFLGRIEHEQGHLDRALSLYNQALKTAHFINNKAVIARAMYERARIFMTRDFDFVQAEDGFRYALTYYASEKDEANMQLAMNSLGNLAQDALSLSEFFLPKLEHDGAPVGKPEEYLIVRCMAIRAEFAVNHQYWRICLLQQAEKVLKTDSYLTSYILHEVERTGEIYNDVQTLNAAFEMMQRLRYS